MSSPIPKSSIYGKWIRKDKRQTPRWSWKRARSLPLTLIDLVHTNLLGYRMEGDPHYYNKSHEENYIAMEAANKEMEELLLSENVKYNEGLAELEMLSNMNALRAATASNQAYEWGNKYIDLHNKTGGANMTSPIAGLLGQLQSRLGGFSPANNQSANPYAQSFQGMVQNLASPQK